MLGGTWTPRRGRGAVGAVHWKPSPFRQPYGARRLSPTIASHSRMCLPLPRPTYRPRCRKGVSMYLRQLSNLRGYGGISGLRWQCVLRTSCRNAT